MAGKTVEEAGYHFVSRSPALAPKLRALAEELEHAIEEHEWAVQRAAVAEQFAILEKVNLEDEVEKAQQRVRELNDAIEEIMEEMGALR